MFSTLRECIIRTRFLAALLGACAVLLSGTIEAGADFRSFHLSPTGRYLLKKALEKHDRRADVDAALVAFYSGEQSRYLWIEGKRESHAAREALTLLEQAWTHGLNPERYGASGLRRMMEEGLRHRQAVFELALSRGAALYVRDMTGMRADPDKISQRAEFWRKPVAYDRALAGMAERENPAAYLAGLAPDSMLYRALREEMIRIVNDAQTRAAAHGPTQEIPYIGFLRPGDSHRQIKDIRRFFDVEHKENPFHYDAALADAVMTFQRRNGLTQDGVIGPQTLAAINRGPQEKIRQIIATMERIRWVEPERPERFLLINIPSATLWAIDKGEAVHAMPVIVGSPWRRTRSFTTEIRGVRINPHWRVPNSIKNRDLLPTLREEPELLMEKNIELVRGFGHERQTIDPGAIDWPNATWRDLRDIRMVQMPGDDNALGRYRVLMPNRYNIYLHDTNKPEYFTEKPSRFLSSGCVRLSEPQKIVHFIMAGTPEWSQDLLDETLESLEETDFESAATMPVYIVYYSIWVGEGGRLVFGPDIYNRDKELLAALEEGGHLFKFTPENASGLSLASAQGSGDPAKIGHN